MVTIMNHLSATGNCSGNAGLNRGRVRPGENGQALVELIVVLPVLLLLLLAAADMGKLFVISGKSEIAARYTVLRHFRDAPFGDLYPAHSEGEEIERIFFDDALDDKGEDDDPDVTYVEYGDADLLYVPPDLNDPLLIALWDNFDIIRGVRSGFTYDLPNFPYGREEPFEQTAVLQAGSTGDGVAASYDANGDFVCLIEAFSGDDGEAVRRFMELEGFLVPFGSSSMVAFVIAVAFFLGL